MVEERQPKYPKRESIVTVEFNDGEVKEFRIDASARIARFLARDASDNGAITLLYGGTAHSIPLSSIKMWTIQEVE